MEVKAINKKIGEEVRMLRLSKNYSQEALADELGISISTLSNLERGQTEFTVSRLYEVVQLLELSIFDFLKRVHKGETFHYTTSTLNEDPSIYSDINSRADRLEAEIRFIKAAIEELRNK